MTIDGVTQDVGSNHQYMGGTLEKSGKRWFARRKMGWYVLKVDGELKGKYKHKMDMLIDLQRDSYEEEFSWVGKD